MKSKGAQVREHRKPLILYQADLITLNKRITTNKISRMLLSVRVIVITCLSVRLTVDAVQKRNGKQEYIRNVKSRKIKKQHLDGGKKTGENPVVSPEVRYEKIYLFLLDVSFRLFLQKGNGRQ